MNHRHERMRGTLLCSETRGKFAVRKYGVIGVGLLIAGFAYGCTLYILLTPSLREGLFSKFWVTAAVIVAIPGAPGLTGIWALLIGLRMTRIRVYDNGFVSWIRSWRSLLKRREDFITWDQIRSMEFPTTSPIDGSPIIGWQCDIVLKNGRRTSISSFSFDDFGMDAFRKFKEIKKRTTRGDLPDGGGFSKTRV